MLCLQHLEGRTYDPSVQPEKVVLKPSVTRFGRSDKNNVVIDSSISPLMISRIHAEINFVEGKFRIDCKGVNGVLVNQKKRSSAVLCEGDEIVFGGAGTKTKEGQTVSSYDSELVYVFKELCSTHSEEANSLGEGTSDGRVRRRSKRKQPLSTSKDLSGPPDKKNKLNQKNKQDTTDHGKVDQQENKKDDRSKKCLADLNEELLCCICRELMVLAHTLPCSHTFCFGCIKNWLGHSSDCPNCRARAQLKSAVPVKVLDNTINKVAQEVLTEEELKERQLNIQEMSEEVKNKKTKVITVSSDSDSDMDDSDSDSSADIDFDFLFGGEEFHYDYHYSVEHARSGRAQCRTCHFYIDYRSLRWIVEFKTRWEHYRQTHYHHLECFLPPHRITYDYLAISPELTRAEHRLVKQRFRER